MGQLLDVHESFPVLGNVEPNLGAVLALVNHSAASISTAARTCAARRVGQTDGKRRRRITFTHPGKSQHTGVQVSSALTAHLRSGQQASLLVAYSGSLSTEPTRELNLSHRPDRELAKAAAAAHVVAEGGVLINLRPPIPS